MRSNYDEYPQAGGGGGSAGPPQPAYQPPPMKGQGRGMMGAISGMMGARHPEPDPDEQGGPPDNDSDDPRAIAADPEGYARFQQQRAAVQGMQGMQGAMGAQGNAYGQRPNGSMRPQNIADAMRQMTPRPNPMMGRSMQPPPPQPMPSQGRGYGGQLQRAAAMQRYAPQPIRPMPEQRGRGGPPMDGDPRFANQIQIAMRGGDRGAYQQAAQPMVQPPMGRGQY